MSGTQIEDEIYVHVMRTTFTEAMVEIVVRLPPYEILDFIERMNLARLDAYGVSSNVHPRPCRLVSQRIPDCAT